MSKKTWYFQKHDIGMVLGCNNMVFHHTLLVLFCYQDKSEVSLLDTEVVFLTEGKLEQELWVQV